MPDKFEVSVLTMMTGPTPQAGQAEVMAMIKAAVLYSDAVSIASPAVAMLEEFARAPEFGPIEILDYCASYFLQYPAASAASPEWLAWADRRLLGRAVRSDLAMDAGLLENFRDAGEAQKLVDIARPFLDDLQAAERSGVLSVRRISPLRPWNLREMAAYWRAAYATIDAEESRGTFLALDEGVQRRLAGPPVAAGRTTPHRVATALFEHLPSFPAASMSDILQLRDEAADSLVGLRAQIMGLSSQIPADVSDAAFRSDIESRYAATIAPAVADLKRQVSELRFGKVLAERALQKGTLVKTGGAAALGFAAIGQPAAFGAALGAALAVSYQLGDLVADTVNVLRERTQAVRRNRLYLFVAAASPMTGRSRASIARP